METSKGFNLDDLISPHWLSAHAQGDVLRDYPLPLECPACAAQKALEGIVDWLNWMEENHPEEPYAYGGPSRCEYACLPGTASILYNWLSKWKDRYKE